MCLGTLSFVDTGEDAVTKGPSLACVFIPEPCPEGFLGSAAEASGP